MPPRGGGISKIAAAHRSIALKLGRLKDWGLGQGNASLIAHISSIVNFNVYSCRYLRCRLWNIVDLSVQCDV